MTPVSAKLAVASLSADVAHDQAVEAGLDGLATVWHCATAKDLLDLLFARQANAVVVGLLDRTGASVAPLVARARRRYPGLRMVIDAPATPAAFREIPAVLWAGASEVSIRGYDRLRDTIESVLAPDWEPGAGRALLDTVPRMVPWSLKAFAIACALKGSPRLTVDLVAEWVGTSPRTVRSRLRRASLSSPLGFVRYCSAAHAMCLLYPQGLHPNRVVERMRFGTRRALNDLVQDYADDSTERVPRRWAYAAHLLRADQFLRRNHPRRLSQLELLPQVDRYMARELNRDARTRFRLWWRDSCSRVTSVVGALCYAWDNPAATRQRKEETWARLLGPIDSELEPFPLRAYSLGRPR